MSSSSTGFFDYPQKLEAYKLVRVIGKNPYGGTYSAVRIDNNEKLNMTVMSMKALQAVNTVELVRKEVVYQTLLQHPSILKIHTSFEDASNIYVVTELCDGEHLEARLKKAAEPFSEDEARRIMDDVIEGILYLRQNKIYHSELSLSHLMLNRNMNAKITNCGFETRDIELDEESEVCSLGCLLYSLVAGKPPFDVAGSKSTLQRRAMADDMILNHLSAEAQHLLKKLLATEPGDRISLVDVKDHPFFKLSKPPSREIIYLDQGKCNMWQRAAQQLEVCFGPQGKETVFISQTGKRTSTNDGLTILKILSIRDSPSTDILISLAQEHRDKFGDGTSSVVLLAAELLRKIEPQIKHRIDLESLKECFSIASEQAMKTIQKLSVKTAKSRRILEKCAAAALNSHLSSQQRKMLSEMVVEAGLKEEVDIVSIKHVANGQLENSELVHGIGLCSTLSLKYNNLIVRSCNIALLNIELELKAERDNTEIENVEWRILHNKLEKIRKSGANVVLSELPIGDLATNYFANNDMICAGCVVAEDLKSIMTACGGAITTADYMSKEVLAHCEKFEEKEIDGARFIFFLGCPKVKICTFILRGSTDQFSADIKSSLYDAIVLVRRMVKIDAVVAGGGAIEMELARKLSLYSITLKQEEKVILEAIAGAFEVIPRLLSKNAGLNTHEIMKKLREEHCQGMSHYGIDFHRGLIRDTLEHFVWESAAAKLNTVLAAFKAVCAAFNVETPHLALEENIITMPIFNENTLAPTVATPPAIERRRRNVSTSERRIDENVVPDNYLAVPNNLPIVPIAGLSRSKQEQLYKANKYFPQVNWWENSPIAHEEACKHLPCPYEPQTHPEHDIPPTIDMTEKKIMIKYLISKNLLTKVTTLSIYRDMQKDGYLTHRNVDALKSSLRSIPLNELAHYNLSEEHHRILSEILGRQRSRSREPR